MVEELPAFFFMTSIPEETTNYGTHRKQQIFDYKTGGRILVRSSVDIAQMARGRESSSPQNFWQFETDLQMARRGLGCAHGSDPHSECHCR
jgi:hypothetical protein